GEQLYERGEGRDVNRLPVRLDQLAHAQRRRVRRGLEGGEADRLARRLDDSERAVICADQFVCAFEDVGSQLAEVGARVQEIRDLKQRARAVRLAPLVREEPRVLVADGD